MFGFIILFFQYCLIKEVVFKVNSKAWPTMYLSPAVSDHSCTEVCTYNNEAFHLFKVHSPRLGWNRLRVLVQQHPIQGKNRFRDLSFRTNSESSKKTDSSPEFSPSTRPGVEALVILHKILLNMLSIISN